MGISTTSHQRVLQHHDAIQQAASRLAEAVEAANRDNVRVRFARGEEQPGGFNNAPVVVEIAHCVYVAPRPKRPEAN